MNNGWSEALSQRCHTQHGQLLAFWRVLRSPSSGAVAAVAHGATGTTAKASEKDRARDGCEEEPGTPRRVRGRDDAGLARARPVGAGRRGRMVAARRRGVAVGGGGVARGRPASAERVPGERASRPRAPGQWVPGKWICRERAPGDRIPGERAAAGRRVLARQREVARKRRLEAPPGIGRPRSGRGPLSSGFTDCRRAGDRTYKVC